MDPRLDSVQAMNIRAIVLHHTATGIGSGDGSDIVANLEYLCKVKYGGRYKNSYHFLVGPTGKVFTGQPIGMPAPHCGIDETDKYQDISRVTNQNSIAISAIGNFVSIKMPEAQYQAILAKVKELKKQYLNAFIKLHSELVSTACPGTNYPSARLFADLQNKPEEWYPKDVNPKAWYNNPVQYCLKKGFMKVDERSNFNPNDKLTRAELAQVIMNLTK